MAHLKLRYRDREGLDILLLGIMYRKWAVIVAVIIGLAYLGWKKIYYYPEYREIATEAPNINSRKIHLRVAHAINPRIEHFSDLQLRIFLRSLRSLANKKFNIEIEFSDIEVVKVTDILDKIPYDYRLIAGARTASSPYEINYDFYQDVKSIKKLYKFSKPYLIDPPKAFSVNAFTNSLETTAFNRLFKLQEIKGRDGIPIIDKSRQHEWALWTMLGYAGLPYDLIITNQLIASATFNDFEVHSALRGELAVGTTFFSASGSFGAAAYITSFPFTNNAHIIRQLRDNDIYSDVEAAQLAGEYAVHEIGHMLFRYGHPFNVKECVMNPAKLLRFKEWSNNITDQVCPYDEHPEMEFGAVSLSRIILDGA